MKTMSVRLSDELHELIVEAADAEQRSRHQWIVRALERAVTGGHPLMIPGDTVLARGGEPDNLRVTASAAEIKPVPLPAPVDPSTGEILGDGPPETAMTRTKGRAQSTKPPVYRVLIIRAGPAFRAEIEDVEHEPIVAPSQREAERDAREFLNGHTDGYFDMKVVRA